jgi:hypothetical protein
VTRSKSDPNQPVLSVMRNEKECPLLVRSTEDHPGSNGRSLSDFGFKARYSYPQIAVLRFDNSVRVSWQIKCGCDAILPANDLFEEADP